MYNNNCTKCGKAFETKNPKRIVCPECLYMNKASDASYNALTGGGQPAGGSYGGGGYQQRPPQGAGASYGGGGGYQQRPQGPRPYQGGGQGGPRPYAGGGGGYGQRPQGGPRPGGGRPGGPRPFGGGRPGGRPGGPRPGGPRGGPDPKRLLFPREVMMDIEKRYKEFLPLPNPDTHVKIGEAMQLEPNKVFFAINVIRQKMHLPKLEFPKRPLAVTPDQIDAVSTLYSPYLPLPPIGIHKIIAKQLRMDEWRVHVAIGLIRKQQGIERWNEERDDLPEKMKQELAEMKQRQAEAAEKAAAEKAETEKAAPEKPKKAKKTEEPAAEAAEQAPVAEEAVVEAPAVATETEETTA